MSNLRVRLVVVLAAIVISVMMFTPISEKINLGLDLRGGTHMVLRVPGQEVLEAELERDREYFESSLVEKNVTTPVVRDGMDLLVSDVPVAQQQIVDDVIESQFAQGYQSSSQARDGLRSYRLGMRPVYQNKIREDAVNQARTVITRRVDEYGVAEPTITIYGSGQVKDQIIVELPGVDDFQRVENIIRKAGRLEFRLAYQGVGLAGPFPSEDEALKAHNYLLPNEYEVLPARTADQYWIVRKVASISGSHIKPGSVVVGNDPYTNVPEVAFQLNVEGATRFSKTTRDNKGEVLAIIMDDRVFNTPRIDNEIRDQGRITGLDSVEEAQDLSVTLRSGSLPAKPVILETRNIGPSLGRESIRNGLVASLVGLILVIAAMLIIYRLSGINAIICLAINLMILLGVLAGFRATLTLPGIAGIILTIGMAVDANILIFERIKEELRAGKTVRSAVDAGFGRVFFTIIDTNVTTLVAALFLFQFGTGPVQGFAVTLAVGLLANIFTAVFASRTFFGLLLQNRNFARLSI